MLCWGDALLFFLLMWRDSAGFGTYTAPPAMGSALLMGQGSVGPSVPKAEISLPGLRLQLSLVRDRLHPRCACSWAQHLLMLRSPCAKPSACPLRLQAVLCHMLLPFSSDFFFQGFLFSSGLCTVGLGSP